MDNLLLPLFLCALLLLLYPILVVFLAVTLNLGAYAWLVVAGMLSPFAVTWYTIERERLINYLKLLLDNKPREWNIEKTIEEYKQLLKKNKTKPSSK